MEKEIDIECPTGPKSANNRKRKTPSKVKNHDTNEPCEISNDIQSISSKKSRKLTNDNSFLYEDRFPQHFQHLLMFFDLCDKIYCFLSKMNMKCSVENLGRMYGNLLSFSTLSTIPGWQEFKPENLVAICSFCPSDFLLTDYQVMKNDIYGQLTPGNISEYSDSVSSTESKTMIEFTFKRFLGIGKGNIEKRRKLLVEAMTKFVIDDFLQKQQELDFSITATNEIVKSVNQSCWPSWYLVNDCPLPDLSSVSKQTELRKACEILGLGSPLSQKQSFITNKDDGKSLKKRPIFDGFSDNCAGELTHALAEIRQASFYRGQLRHVSYFPAREAIFADLDRPLLPILQERLTETYKITRFYRHQAAALNFIRQGKHVMISTSTASGKSMIFNLPVTETLLQEQTTATALYLFPTKALAQDQLRSLLHYLGPKLNSTVVPVVCDGDTSQSDRGDIIRGAGNVILTNPDMLHHTLLPDHKTWQRLFVNLKYVVLDEAHLYNGSFGSHVACVLRRLLRVCLAYNSMSFPQFICCSATISNPLELMTKLLPLYALRGIRNVAASPLEGDATNALESKVENNIAAEVNEDLNVAVVGHELDGAPHGERGFVIWNPHGLESEEIDNQQENNSSVPNTKDDQLSMNENEELNMACDEFAPSVIASVNKSATNTKENASSSTPQLELDERLIQDMRIPSTNVSIIYETAVLFAALVQLRLRTIAFCKTRKLVELVYKYCLRELKRNGHSDLLTSVSSYRGGYTDQERRSIEQELFSHRLLGVAATCALELGIDVGSLDVTLHMGFPGSFSSLWQQAGRAGRSGRASLSFIICFECPVDQYFARFPEKLLSKASIEPAVLDVDNLLILKSHLACAAKEIPLNFDFQYFFSSLQALQPIKDTDIWGKNFVPAIEILLDHYSIRPVTKHLTRENYLFTKTLFMYWSDGAYAKNEAAKKVNLRMIDPVTIDIIDVSKGNDHVIDSMEYSRAFFELYENAIFLHRGQQFLVRLLDLSQKKAHTVPVKVKYTTSARNMTTITVIKDVESYSSLSHLLPSNNTVTPSLCNPALVRKASLFEQSTAQQKHLPCKDPFGNDIKSPTLSQVVVHYGVVQVVHRVYGYLKRWLRNGEVFEIGECSLPPMEYETTAVWIDLPLKTKLTVLEKLSTEKDKDIVDTNSTTSVNNNSEIANSKTITCYRNENTIMSCMHAANHVLLQCGALVGHSGCDVSDLGTEHDVQQGGSHATHNHRPFRLLLYDKRPGGLGACANIFITMAKVVQAGVDIVRLCPCRYGCPSCILDCRCSAYNRGVHKQGALFLLESIAESLGVASTDANIRNITINSNRVNGNNEVDQCVTCSSIMPSTTIVNSNTNIRSMGKDDILDLSDSDDENNKIRVATNHNHHDDNKSILKDVRRQLVEISPTKQQKQMMLTKVTIRDSARARGIAIQSKWTEVIPDFITDRHNDDEVSGKKS